MHVRRSTLCGIISVAVTSLATACATAHTRPPAYADDTPPAEQLTLSVDNHNWSDVLIYVVHDGVRSRFIEVTATRSTSSVIPAALVPPTGMVQLLVHRIGGHDDSVSITGADPGANELTRDDYLSPRVSVKTGTVIKLTLESSLKRSTVGVW